MAKDKYNKNNKNWKNNDKGNQKRDRDCRNNDKRSDKEVLDPPSKLVINEASWYIPDPEIRNQVGSFSMNSTVGIDTILEVQDDAHEVAPVHIKTPSVMGIYLNPSCGTTYRDILGFANAKMSAINMAAREMYTKISSVNAKTTQYQPQDLAIAILAVGELISLISVARRAYGICFNYSNRNRDIPRAILRATGLNPDSILDDLSGFRMKLNKLLVPANQIVMIDNIKYHTKCWQLYEKYFVDSSSAMAQAYIMSPATYWLLDESTETGSKLKTTYIHSSHTGYDYSYDALDLLNAIKKVTDALLTSTTLNYIYTDIRNYVQKMGGKLYSFGYLEESYIVQPEYNAEFLLQIHNLKTMSAPENDNNDVTQDPANNVVIYEPKFPLANWVLTDSILDFPGNDNPTPDDKINAMMFKTQARLIASSSSMVVFDAAIPDHYPVYIKVISGEETLFYSQTLIPENTDGYRRVCPVTMFDWAPIMYTVDPATNSVISTVGDLNFYDAVHFKQLKDVFEYSYLGLFKFGD